MFGLENRTMSNCVQTGGNFSVKRPWGTPTWAQRQCVFHNKTCTSEARFRHHTHLTRLQRTPTLKSSYTTLLDMPRKW